MNRYEELLKGNKTLTDKVTQLEIELKKEKKANRILRCRNYSMEKTIEILRHKIEFLKDELEKNPLSKINELINILH